MLLCSSKYIEKFHSAAFQQNLVIPLKKQANSVATSYLLINNRDDNCPDLHSNQLATMQILLEHNSLYDCDNVHTGCEEITLPHGSAKVFCERDHFPDKKNIKNEAVIDKKLKTYLHTSKGRFCDAFPRKVFRTSDTFTERRYTYDKSNGFTN